MKKLILCLLSFTCISSALAGKTYMGLVPTSTDYYAIVSMTEKPCVAGDENAIYMSEGKSGKVSAVGQAGFFAVQSFFHLGPKPKVVAGFLFNGIEFGNDGRQHNTHNFEISTIPHSRQ